MKLLSAGASPYVAKAAMAAKHCGVAVESIAVDATNGDPALQAANPLGKIPCLVLDDGTGLFDSRVITRYLDRISGGKLFPSDGAALLAAERMEALCDGINDCSVGYMYELRFHPEEKVEQEWLDRLWSKAENGLDAVAQDLPSNGADLTIGSIALFSCLSYLDLRFAGKWETGRDTLVQWHGKFGTNHPELAVLKPHA